MVLRYVCTHVHVCVHVVWGLTFEICKASGLTLGSTASMLLTSSLNSPGTPPSAASDIRLTCNITNHEMASDQSSIVRLSMCRIRGKVVQPIPSPSPTSNRNTKMYVHYANWLNNHKTSKMHRECRKALVQVIHTECTMHVENRPYPPLINTAVCILT